MDQFEKMYRLYRTSETVAVSPGYTSYTVAFLYSYLQDGSGGYPSVIGSSTGSEEERIHGQDMSCDNEEDDMNG